jgi:hypothetical protein
VIHNLLRSFAGLDWPNLIAGAALGAVVWLLTRAYETLVASKDLPYAISGTWYSAEYDPKVLLDPNNSTKDPPDPNTFTEVKVRRLLGARFSIRVVKQLGDSGSRPATAWKFSGDLIYGDTLVGTWKSIVKDTKRYGAAMLKFIDKGRAVGYWIGPAGTDYPVYGYWVMSRNHDDVKKLANSILQNSGFQFFDVAGYVLPPRPEKNKGSER